MVGGGPPLVAARAELAHALVERFELRVPDLVAAECYPHRRQRLAGSERECVHVLHGWWFLWSGVGDGWGWDAAGFTLWSWGWPAMEVAHAAAGRFDPSFRGLYAHCQVRIATALVLCEEIGEAARILGAAAGTASSSPSPRLTTELRAARAQLQPWQGAHAVNTLDAQLAACGVAGPSPSRDV